MNHNEWDIKEKTDVPMKGPNHRYLTEGLFIEFGNPEAVYTLSTKDKVRDGKTYISMYKVYMECSDEYEAAERIVGSQQHWERLCNAKFFMEGHYNFNNNYGLAKWREDMRKRDESLAKRTLIEQAKNGNVNAAKALQAEPKKTKKKEEPSNVKDNDDIFTGYDKANTGVRNVQ